MRAGGRPDRPRHPPPARRARQPRARTWTPPTCTRSRGALDDIVDFAEEAADQLGALRRRGADGAGRRQIAEVLVARRRAGRRRACAGCATASTLGPQLVEIHRLENEADRIAARRASPSLFVDGIDPMIVIRWKDIFDIARGRGRRLRDGRQRARGHLAQAPRLRADAPDRIRGRMAEPIVIAHRGASGYGPSTRSRRTSWRVGRARTTSSRTWWPRATASSWPPRERDLRHHRRRGPPRVRRSPGDQGDRRQGLRRLVRRGLHARRAQDAARAGADPGAAAGQHGVRRAVRDPDAGEVIELAAAARRRHLPRDQASRLPPLARAGARAAADSPRSRAPACPWFVQSFEAASLRELPRPPRVQLIGRGPRPTSRRSRSTRTRSGRPRPAGPARRGRGLASRPRSRRRARRRAARAPVHVPARAAASSPAGLDLATELAPLLRAGGRRRVRGPPGCRRGCPNAHR